MADILTTFTNFINSPPGQLVAGGVLAGIVWKFFERVEDVLTDDTKLEITAWLADQPPIGRRFAVLDPSVLTRLIGTVVSKLFRRFLPTEKSFSRTWKLLGVATCVLAGVSLLRPHSISRIILAEYTKDGGFDAGNFFGSFFFTSLFAALATHIAFVATRLISKHLERATSFWQMSILFLVNSALTPLFVALSIIFLGIMASFEPDVRHFMASWADRVPTASELAECSVLVTKKSGPFVVIILPMALVNLSMTMLVGLVMSSASVLGAIRRLDAGFNWFNRNFDIENKPLSAVGFVAGVLMAIIYWTVVILSLLIHHGR